MDEAGVGRRPRLLLSAAPDLRSFPRKRV